MEYLEKGGAEGDERCDYVLATLLMSGGTGLARDPVAAIGLLHNAASHGLPEAQFELGYHFETGAVIESDQAAAVEWYRKAAEAGLPMAQTQMGFILSHGEGVEKDSEEAANWYKKAARRGDPLAQTALGAALFEGTGVERDLVDAYMWTKLAANQANKKARSNLRIIVKEMSKSELWKARKKVRKFRPTGERRKRIHVKNKGYGDGGRRMSDARRGGVPGR